MDYTLTLIKNNPEWFAIFLFTLIEAWLGRNRKVNNGPIMGFIFRVLFKNKFIRVVLIALFKAFSRRK